MSILNQSHIDVLDPTKMSDEVATKLGLKEYSEANGDFTVSGTNWTTDIALAIPYQTKDGNWRMRFNITGTLSSATSGAFTGTISGVTFFSTEVQAISVGLTEDGVSNRVTVLKRTAAGSGDFSVQAESGSFDLIRIFGDVRLDSKPTWAA